MLKTATPSHTRGRRRTAAHARGALTPLTEDRELDVDHIESLIHDLHELHDHDIDAGEYATVRVTSARDTRDPRDDRDLEAYEDARDAELDEEERPRGGEERRKAASERYEHYGHDLADVWTMKSGKAPLLTAAQEIVLAKRAERGDPQAKEELLNANVRLVASVARRYLGRGLPLEDLMQEGMIGLMRAIEKYNYRKGYRFSTYATHWIRQAVSRALANQGRSIRLPAHVVDAIGRIARIREELFHKYGRPPTRVEVAEAAGITEKKLVQLIRSAVHPVSLDSPVGEEGESRLGDFVHAGDESSPSDRVFKSLVHEELEHALNAHLTPREKDVLALRYGLGEEEPHTLEETGRRLHITRERARQIESKALEKLRHIQVSGRLREAVT